MTSMADIAERALMEGVGHELAATIPPAARRRGWGFVNLEHGLERIPGVTYEVDNGEEDEGFTTPERVREYWSVDVHAPTPDCEWREYVGGQAVTVLQLVGSVVGSLVAPTPEALVRHAQAMVTSLGLDHLPEL